MERVVGRRARMCEQQQQKRILLSHDLKDQNMGFFYGSCSNSSRWIRFSWHIKSWRTITTPWLVTQKKTYAKDFVGKMELGSLCFSSSLEWWLNPWSAGTLVLTSFIFLFFCVSIFASCYFPSCSAFLTAEALGKFHPALFLVAGWGHSGGGHFMVLVQW